MILGYGASGGEFAGMKGKSIAYSVDLPTNDVFEILDNRQTHIYIYIKYVDVNYLQQWNNV